MFAKRAMHSSWVKRGRDVALNTNSNAIRHAKVRFVLGVNQRLPVWLKSAPDLQRPAFFRPTSILDNRFYVMAVQGNLKQYDRVQMRRVCLNNRDAPLQKVQP